MGYWITEEPHFFDVDVQDKEEEEEEEEYTVTWTIDILASSPQHAAEQALEIQRDLHSEATVFMVRKASEDGSYEDVSVDLG